MKVYTEPAHQEERHHREDRAQLDDHRECRPERRSQPQRRLSEKQVPSRRHWHELGEAFDQAEKNRLQDGCGVHALRRVRVITSSGISRPFMVEVGLPAPLV